MKEQATESTDTFIKRSEAARRLGVTPHSIYRYERAGLLTPYRRNSRLTFYSAQEVEQFAHQGTTTVSA